MKPQPCEFEESVLRAAQTNHWDPELEAHVSRCAACTELVGVSEWMRQCAEASVVDLRLPDPSRIWWKAQLLQRHEAQEQAVRPIRIFQNAAFVVIALLMLRIVSSHWVQIKSWFSALEPGWKWTWSLFSLTPFFATLLIVSVGLVCLSVLFTLFAALSEN